jgi:Mrp family chromosome partitioning ATPase
VSKSSKKTSRRAKSGEAALGTELARGGLAIHARDHDGPGQSLFHVVPADVARSLRFFLARLQQDDDLTVHQTIAVTAALAGEGVTFTSRSLAAILAHDLDRTVCLVETNWWPDAVEDDGDEVPVPTDGSAPDRPGLADLLRGSCDLDAALIRTDDDRLGVIRAGTQPVGERAAAVGGSAFSDLLDSLAKGFDIVVIDVPPVLMASEATTIARQAEAVVLVVRQGVTTEDQVRTAIDDLAGCALQGVVMNRTSTHVPRRLRRFGLSA